MTDDTPLESRPPDSETPTGTSAIMCRRITRSKRSANLPAYSSSDSEEENSGLTSGFQYLVSVRPPVGGHRHVVAREKPFDAREEGLVPGVMHTVQEEPVQHAHVRGARHIAVLEERLQLGGEQRSDPAPSGSREA